MQKYGKVGKHPFLCINVADFHPNYQAFVDGVINICPKLDEEKVNLLTETIVVN